MGTGGHHDHPELIGGEPGANQAILGGGYSHGGDGLVRAGNAPLLDPGDVQDPFRRYAQTRGQINIINGALGNIGPELPKKGHA